MSPPGVTSRQPGNRLTAALAAAIVGAFAVAGWLMITSGRPLTYEEAVYATRARELVTGIPATRFAEEYRPPVLPMLGTLAGAFGWSEVALRTITLALASLAMAAVWLLARIVFGGLAALIALAAAIGAPSVLESTWAFENDLGAAGLMLLAMAFLWHELEIRGTLTRRILLVVPLFAAAFYLRYGSVVFIGALSVVALGLWWRTIRMHLRVVAAGIALGVVLLIPHLVEAQRVTGLPVGIMAHSLFVVARAPIVETAALFGTWLVTGTLAGLHGLVLIVLGAAGASVVLVAAARRRSLSPDARRIVWIVLPAALVVGGLLTTHAEARYVLFPILLALILGAALVVRVGRAALDSGGRLAPVVGAAAVAVVVLSMGANAVVATRAKILEQGRAAEVQAWRREIGAFLAADSGGRCWTASAVATAVFINWYGACIAVLADSVSPAERPWITAGFQGYLVVSPDDDRGLPADVLAEYRRLSGPSPLVVYEGRRGSTAAEVYRLSP